MRQKLREFLWEIFASHYLELVKTRAYNEQKIFTKEQSESARYALHFLLERFLTLAYPIIPQITSTIAKECGIDLHNTEFPKAKKGKSDLNQIKTLMDFNSLVWKAKKDKQISLREKIDGIDIPKELSAFKGDLKACHNL